MDEAYKLQLQSYSRIRTFYAQEALKQAGADFLCDPRVTKTLPNAHIWWDRGIYARSIITDIPPRKEINYSGFTVGNREEQIYQNLIIAFEDSLDPGTKMNIDFLLKHFLGTEGLNMDEDVIHDLIAATKEHAQKLKNTLPQNLTFLSAPSRRKN